MVKSITTNTTREAVLIDGVTFFVRPMGVRQQLRIFELQKEFGKDLSEDEQIKAVKEFYDIFESIFSDDNNGKDIADLFDRLDPEQLADIIAQIFNPEQVTADGTDTAKPTEA